MDNRRLVNHNEIFGIFGTFGTFGTSSKSSGFSYLEVIIVVGLLTIVLAIGVPFFLRGSAQRKLSTVSKQLQTDLEYAKSHARTGGEEVTFAFTGSIQGPTGYNILDIGGRTLRSFAFEESLNVDISGINPLPIVFKSTGSCASAGSIVLRSPRTKKYYTINITSASGLIRLNENN